MTGGAVEAFGNLNPRLRGVGLASVLGGFVIAVYNVIYLSWSAIYFFHSFDTNNTLPWQDNKVDEYFGSYVLKVFNLSMSSNRFSRGQNLFEMRIGSGKCSYII
eukprot:sb/3478052/